jgi:hypothetical protein
VPLIVYEYKPRRVPQSGHAADNSTYLRPAVLVEMQCLASAATGLLCPLGFDLAVHFGTRCIPNDLMGLFQSLLRPALS